jgi:uncharacterized protein (TIGR00369 family)
MSALPPIATAKADSRNRSCLLYPRKRTFDCAIGILLQPDEVLSRGAAQQHGFVHAGAVSAIADTAAGYAALTLMPADTGVLTTEFKINLLAPAAGERILARGRVVKAGRTLILSQAEVFANTADKKS